MLAVQEYLRSGQAVADLAADLGINAYRHPDLPLVGLKYSQTESPKTHPIVRECRGLVLEDGSWDVVAKPFRRFFNAGEDAENFRDFDWGDFTCTTKEDGSLIILYSYRGSWHANTSGSFGLGECGSSGRTWRDLFWDASRIDPARLDPEMTYLFELWTPYNKVIRVYPRPAAFLLSMFHVPTLREAPVAEADLAAARLGVERPAHHRLGSMDEIAAFLRDKEAGDKTYEGVVIRDGRDERYKIKTQTYLSLHHLMDNGNVFNPRRLVPLVLAGETDEVLAYIPEVKPHLDRVVGEIGREYEALRALWEQVRAIESQKEFALAIVRRTKFSGLLFQLRKERGPDQDEAALMAKWRESADLIVKQLYG